MLDDLRFMPDGDPNMDLSKLPTVAYVAAVDLAEPNAATLHVTAITRELARRGYPVTLVVPRPSGSEPASQIDRSVRVRFTTSTRRLSLPNSAGVLLLLPTVCGLILRGHAQVVYIRFSPLSFLISAIARSLARSHVISEHNGWMAGELLALGYKGPVARLVAVTQWLDAMLANEVLVVSPMIGRHLERIRIPERKIFVAENGTDTDEIHPLRRVDALAAWEFPQDQLYVGFLGTLSAWQGIEALLRSFSNLLARVPSAHLLIGGDGPEGNALVELTRVLGIDHHVTFAGPVPLTRRNSFLNCFDAAVIPRQAGIAELGMSPLKLRDYAAAGLPVVAPDLPGIREFSAEWIALYDSEQPDEMVTILTGLLLNPDLRAAMAGLARIYALQQFSWSKTADIIARRLPAIPQDVSIFKQNPQP